MRERQKPYEDWPSEAAYLNRWTAQYAGRKVAARAVWLTLTRPCTAFTEYRLYGAAWAELDKVAILRFGTAAFLNKRRERKPKVVPGRSALAWLLLARLLPFAVPEGFSAKIREDIGANLPWLILAEWLEENGELGHAIDLRIAVKRTSLEKLPLLKSRAEAGERGGS